MNKKILLTLILGMFLISFTTSLSELPPVEQGECIELFQYCPTCTFVNWTGMIYPNNTINLTVNIEMMKTNTNYNYTFCDTNELGEYHYFTTGDKNNQIQQEEIKFLVTPNGKEFTTQNSLSYLGFIFIFLLVFGMTLYGAITIKWKHKTDINNIVMSANNLRYVKIFLFAMSYMLMMFLFGLSYKFFNEAGIEGFNNFFYWGYQILQSLLIPILISTIIIFVIIFLTNKKITENIELGI